MRPRTWAGLLAAALLAPVLPAATAAAAGPGWGACPFDVGASGATCTTVEVPVDEAGGPTIDLHVSRAPAKKARQGVLVLNSGGPAAHLADAAAFSTRLPKEVTDRYDLVSFDQRGFGRSAPVACGLTPQEQYAIPWPLPGGRTAVEARARTIADKCRGNTLLPHMGTADAARDLDRIRQALGVERITYLGVSYGTYLGTAYDALFPGRVERMLLDSTVDAEDAWRGVWRTALTDGLEGRLPDFTKRYGNDILATIRAADRNPLVTSAGRVTGTEVRIALDGAMYADEAFPSLAAFLQAVRTRDAAAAATAGTDLQVWYDDDNTASGQLAVFCADGRFPRDPDVYARQAAAAARQHPLTGGASAAIWPCAHWPETDSERIRVRDRGPGNVLLINNRRDPATTYAGARDLQRSFGGRASLVSVDHGGHGAYLRAGNACADRAGTDFLLTGRAADVDCPATYAALQGALHHLTTVDGTPGALAEVRDEHGREVLTSGVRDVRTGAAPRAGDRFRAFSNTKAFVATVVLQLVAEGKVELDAPVERYLPGPYGPTVTVRSLLQHTSGLPDYDASVFEPGRYHETRLEKHEPGELVANALAKPRLSREFHYSTTNYVLAGMLVERVTGRSWEHEVTQRIVRPLGLRHTSIPAGPGIAAPHLRGYTHLDAQGGVSDSGRLVDATPLDPSLVWAGGAMVSTVEDLTTFFAVLVGGRLLPPAQLAAMTTTVPSDLIPGSRYGLGLVQVPLSCGGAYWGHGGEGLGYQSRGGVTGDGRAVSLVHTTSPSTRQQSADALAGVDAALCESAR